MTLDREEQVVIKPDLLWHSASVPLAVMDAKYKQVAPAEMLNGLLYQMLAYCTALGLQDGWLVYAAGNATTFTATVERAGIAVRCAVVDLAQSPGELLQSLRVLAHSAAEASPKLAVRQPA
jgi:5-methylcytosine-specific restriction enzyme subunit McrC